MANDCGIYGVYLYIRGKPWLITVDDYLLFSWEHLAPAVDDPAHPHDDPPALVFSKPK